MKLKKILPLAISLSLMAGCSGKKQSATPTNEEIYLRQIRDLLQEKTK